MKGTRIEDAIAEANANMFLDSIAERCEVACPNGRSRETICVPDAATWFCLTCRSKWQTPA